MKNLILTVLISFVVILITFFIFNQNHSDYDFTINKETEGYSYAIMHNDKIIIFQKHIPAVKGNQNFKNIEDARKTALLVLDKIESKQLPSVTIEELKDLNITFREY